jgi:hypothetical protein
MIISSLHTFKSFNILLLSILSCNVTEFCIYYRVEDAIEILEYILKLREERLGTANPDADDEKKRLVELLKEARRSRSRKGKKSLENLLDSNPNKMERTKRWSGFSFKN